MKQRAAWLLFVAAAVVAVPAACKKDDTTTTTTSTTTTTTTTTTTGQGGGEPNCKACLQTSAVSGGCTQELTACLGETAGDAGNCQSCSEWALGCQNISTTECNDALAGVCDPTVATAFVTCTCGECPTECPISCAAF